MATLSIDRMGPVLPCRSYEFMYRLLLYMQIVNFFQPVTLRAVGIAVVK